ncbi:molecular chaperone HtpG [Ethanoligenens harbinense]|uniref:Heat shock protein Hsp90-like protein n=1 Tax=Ethanoligenens harbinense (strain DSM 18485 / JCM 12961 / CGMCC 1.5033 / YUAN-3) TaxID=663278 RepID=E6U2V2_ETHHY|nr:molecular chaperone HtpG [Ethanoligenens harbinense]ADU27494.1 Heat shock protein Hsp90-like protein [Ethanoligenens harbinense YUAN-3]AVQ96550.1 molecular chaperone HtpG [Ethanoligenens harbinense YUAN-3]AYF39211.1 molecular chaperone HtpG [Ethanoligenens harbinense]AYF42035.1 molecular chaperone HtpG [Ethanoligenens harbinense]QCN92790.1 molecular chaperone HtpG [Ethanoligenens harbinense]
MREGNIQVHSDNILPIIKKWLYSDKDIFLRELVSNSSDAIRKLERLAGMGEAEKDDAKPFIHVFVDKDDKTLRVEDNGLGMTEEEVEKYITQVAFSGAEEFVKKYKDQPGDEGGIIGHFGLGFYSAFMVADKVEIDTLSYQKDAKPVHWQSKGESAYEIGEGTRTTRGTTVTLHISGEEVEFLEEGRIRGMLRKYCQFMPYEIFLNPKAPEEAKEGEEAPAGSRPVNNPHPLWLKAPKDCTKEEYEQFYTELFMDFNPPLFWIHLNVDYPFNLKGILYFPQQADKVEVQPGEVKLYNNQVYIADNIKEVVPEFLLLLKGVIDCPDLPLNVSRSFLQNDGDVQKISRHITKKVSDKLHEIFNNERENYEKYWDDIAPFIKFGCIRDESFYERVKDIVLLKSINGGYKTLMDFPKDKDNQIFYVSNLDLQAQYVRLFKEEGKDAAVLSHMIDSHFISFLEYKEKEMKFVRIDADISYAVKDGEAGGNAEAVASSFKELLGKDDLTVKAERLKNSATPAVMLLEENARRFQEMSRMYQGGPAAPAPQGTLILNLENSVVQALPTLGKDRAALLSRYIYDLAQLGQKPLTAEEMSGFMERSAKLLALAAGQSETSGTAAPEKE